MQMYRCLFSSKPNALLSSLWTQMLAEQIKALRCHHQLVTLESRPGTALVSPSAPKKLSG